MGGAGLGQVRGIISVVRNSHKFVLQLGGAGQAGDTPMNDTAETVYISSLALLKMLKHGRAGVPMEVMGLMLGQFVDEFTVNVVDVFAMPQSGTVSHFHGIVFLQNFFFCRASRSKPSIRSSRQKCLTC
jgi:hypothetical protein